MKIRMGFVANSSSSDFLSEEIDSSFEFAPGSLGQSIQLLIQHGLEDSEIVDVLARDNIELKDLLPVIRELLDYAV